MSDYFSDPAHPVARKQHRCDGCWWIIPEGEKHVMQSGFYDGAAFRCRYHQECWDELCKLGPNFEGVPGDIDPPERLRANTTGERICEPSAGSKYAPTDGSASRGETT
jgi:hypothetical protein